MESRNWLKEDIEDEAEAITQKQQSWKQKCQSRWQGLGAQFPSLVALSAVTR